MIDRDAVISAQVSRLERLQKRLAVKTDKDMAEILGVNYGTYRQWASGRRVMNEAANTLITWLEQNRVIGHRWRNDGDC